MDTTPVAINGNSKIDEPPSGADHPILDYLPKKVAVIYSEAKREYFPTEEQYITEKSAEYEAGVVGSYLQKLGIEPILIPGDENLTEVLKIKGPEMAINLVESVKGHEDLAPAIPGVLEMLNIPYTGADILGLSITYNKFLTTKLLQQAGVPVPHTQLFYTHNDHLNNELAVSIDYETKCNSWRRGDHKSINCRKRERASRKIEVFNRNIQTARFSAGVYCRKRNICNSSTGRSYKSLYG